MKKIKLFLLLMMLCAGLGARAQELIDGIAYYLDGVYYTASVTSLPDPDKYVGDIVVPEQVNYDGHDYAVTLVGAFAFSECTELTSVTLPATITEIGSYAFFGSSALASVNIPEGITIIDENTFFGCSSLTSITLPESLTEIGYGAFYESGLESITIPANVASIGGSAFADNSNLKTIHVQRATPPTCGDYAFGGVTNTIPVYVPAGSVDAYKAASGWNYFENIQAMAPSVDWDFTDGVLTISGTGPMTDYESYSDVPWYSVQESITSVVIEDGITRIGNSAFKYCSNVASVTISNSVISIGEYAFDDCGMSSIIIPNNVETIEDYAFSNCYNLSTVTIGSGVKSIGHQAFAYDEALAVVTCNAMTPPTLGYDVFYDVPSSCVIYVPAGSVDAYKTADGWNYFTNIKAEGAGSKEIYAALSGSTMTIYFDDQKASRSGVLTDWTPEEGMLNVPDATSNSITKVVINSSMVDARPTRTYCWFYLMVNLTTIDGLANLNTSEVTHMDGMFNFCSSLSSLDLSSFNTDNVTSMSYMFSGCSSLTSLNVSSFNTAKVENMSYMFFSCYSLTSLDLSSFNTANVTNMNNMFYGCSSLTSLDVSGFNTDNVTDMSYMFTYCSSLTSLDVSSFNTDKVTNMKYMFSGCSSLKTIYCDDDWSASSVLEYSDDMFDGCTALVGGKGTKYDDSKTDKTYARPDGLDDQPGYFTSITYTGEALIDGIRYYLSGDDMTAEVMPLGDGYYAGDIVLPEKVSYLKNDYAVTSVAGAAFSNCPELLTVTIPKSVNWIEPEVFYDSPKLTAVNVAAANANYSSLDGVLFNKAQTELRAYPTAKEGAYIVPEGVETIMDATFAENKKLTAITLPASLYEIASRAFENCTGLEMIACRATNVPYLGGDVFAGVNKAIPVFVPKANIALYKAEYEWEDFTNYIAIEDKEAADAVIAKINAIGTVTYTPECKARIDAARGGYDALTAEQKVYITDATYKILTDAEKAYADLKAKAEADQAAANAVIGKIDAIGTVTLSSEAAILDARSAYNALTAAQQALVTNYSVLTAAEAKLEILKKQAESDEAAAKAVTDLINAIGTVTYTSESKARIDAAREAYDALTAAQKALVTNLTTLTAAEKAYADLKAKAEADQAAANIVIGKINAIGTVTYTPESKALIDAAREAYDALTDAQKGLVSAATYKILTDAEQTYADLKKKADADLAAANIVIGKINAIGTVTLSSEAAILDARSAYDALTDAQKVLVTNYGVLTAAEQAYADLKKKADADQAAANAVIVKIDAIGTVTLSSEAAITAARSAYNALTAAQQALVTNYGTLLSAETTLELLKHQAETDQAAANAVIAKIDAIGTVTLSSEAAILDARSAYDALTDAQKGLVTNYGVLTAAEKKLAELKANAEAVANAKLQLKNIVSQANELKMVAMIYAPTVVTDIDAIINDAQSTIDDPNATVDQVNAKVATLTDNLNTLAVSLLDQAKEQLKQSLRDLYQPGDYPSWYASVVIPALDQVDGITWDFSKSVQDNILYFQVTGQNLYNATKAALEALRGTDKRSIISSCAFTGFENGIKVDMTWNISALNNLINTLNTSVASEPYRLDAEMSSLGKWDPENKELIILDPYEAQKLTAGDYQFITAVKIDGEDAKQYRLPKATEEVLSVTVDAAVWSVDLSGIVIDANYSFTYVTSPMFTISKSEDVELVNEDQLKTQKIYHNGHFYILRGEHIYDIQGTLVR